MVSSMQRHPGSGKFYKDLLLTSSLDWTVKLWNLASPGGFENPLLELVIFSSFNFVIVIQAFLLISFVLDYRLVSATYDYVCDVRWSPTNPAVFCTITSGGVLTLWDLSKSTLESQDYFNVLKDSASSVPPGAGSLALNKVAWSLDGSSIYVGDTRGSVRHISVRETSARPRPGDDAR
jgi:WD40 repeat protein